MLLADRAKAKYRGTAIVPCIGSIGERTDGIRCDANHDNLCSGLRARLVVRALSEESQFHVEIARELIAHIAAHISVAASERRQTAANNASLSLQFVERQPACRNCQSHRLQAIGQLQPIALTLFVQRAAM